MQFQCTKCQGIVDVESKEMGNPTSCGHCKNITMVPATAVSEGVVVGGDFVISKQIAIGGMGTIYLAHQITLERPVALKIMHDEYAKDSNTVDNFLREARAAASLNHPNIVQAYAVGESDGHFYFAMEYIEGDSLKDILERDGKIGEDRILPIIQDVGRALDFAWKNQRLVHRDIKPENIMVTKDNVVKLADLGLARYGVESEVREKGDTVYGTPQYIAPEQYLNLDVDVRADLYSLGATAWHLLTGKPPYEASSPADIASMHLNARLPRLYQIEPSVSRSTSVLLSIMMSKRPSLRYNDASEYLKDVSAVLNGEMPKRQLSPLGQVPIFFDKPDPLNIDNLPQDIIALRTPVEVTKKNIVPEERPEGEEDPAVILQRQIQQRAQKKPFNPIPYLVGGLLGLMTIGAGVFIYLDMTKEIRTYKSKYPSYSEDSHQAYLDTKQIVMRKAPNQIQAVNNFLRKYKKSTAYCRELKQMIEPAVMQDIESRRDGRFAVAKDSLMKEWEANNRSHLDTVAREPDVKAIEGNKEAAKRIEAPRVAEMEKEAARLVQMHKSDARSRVTSLCRNGKYNQISQENSIVTLRGWDTKEAQEWAESYLKITSRAKKMDELLRIGRAGDLVNEGGLDLGYYGRIIREKVPAYAYPDNYERVNQYYLHLNNYTSSEVILGFYEIGVVGGSKVNVCSGTKSIAYNLLPFELERKIYDVILANVKLGLTQDALTIIRCAYLFVRGEDLDNVRTDLEALKARPQLPKDWVGDIDFILAELSDSKNIEQFTDSAWCSDMLNFEAIVASNNTAKIELYEKALKLRYRSRLDANESSREDMTQIMNKDGFDYEKYRKKWRENISE